MRSATFFQRSGARAADLSFFYNVSLVTFPATGGEKLAVDNYDAARELFHLGLSHLLSRQYVEAEECFLEALALTPLRVSVLVNLASAQLHLEKLTEALRHASIAADLDQANADAFFNLALIQHRLALDNDALASARKARSLAPGNLSVVRLYAELSDRCGFSQDSLEAYESLLADNPDDWISLCNVGAICNDLKRYQTALSYNLRALKQDPCNPRLISNLALSYAGLELWGDAEALHQKALSISREDPELLANYGSTLTKRADFRSACSIYERALTLDPNSAQLWSNYGVALSGMRAVSRALNCFQRARELDSSYTVVYANIGACYAQAGDSQKAYDAFKGYLVAAPEDAQAWNTFGDCCVDLKKYDESISAFGQALRLDESMAQARGGMLYASMFTHKWDVFKDHVAEVQRLSASGVLAVTPFAALSLFDDPLAHLSLARGVIKKHHPARVIASHPRAGPFSAGVRPIHRRIRLGYFSADFKDHAVARLAIGLFENHDRVVFEIHAFTFFPIPETALGARLKNSFDRVHDLSEVSDDEGAALCRRLEVDIAIDLSGFTAGCRPSLFAYNPAPICVNFLGYPGTMGSSYHHYLLCDHFVCPEGMDDFFDEKLIRLARPYQPNDPIREVSNRRGWFPEHCVSERERPFRFVCFNNCYKIHPDTFDSWARILSACPDSELWLLDEGSESRQGILNSAASIGMDIRQLKFSPRLPQDEHLARLSEADLFLDTYPYNAHTTASDALWAGLPVLTLVGRSFASRVAGSFLYFCGLKNLICESPEQYISKAIGYYRKPDSLQAIRRTLGFRNKGLPLFDAKGYARDFEKAMLVAHERHARGLRCESFDV